ncbi:MAG TPA: ribosome maturation factor RimM [Terracidiphilus sp.]|nr:ribosome maturation factor RimM [Terracidiphilus sp.]
MMPPEVPDEWAWLARIRRTQGRKGEVFAEILTDFPEKFAERRSVWLLAESPAGAPSRQPEITAPPREAELVNHWSHKGGIVLHFAGIDSISAAERLLGLGVAIPKTARAHLSSDEAYISDLIGCALIDVAQHPAANIGAIEDVDRSAGPAPLLIVRSPSREEILIPFAQSYLRRLDTDNKRVEMALPEGLIDLNQPSSA